jgi:hypothetical protein
MKQLPCCLTILVSISSISAQEPLLKPNDRVALLGGTFVERMQSSGGLEAVLQTRRPDWKLSIRNLGWSGDDVHGTARKVFGDAGKGFQRLLQDVQTADPTVVIVAYGFSEASDGAEAVDKFQAGLQKLVAKLLDQERRVILVAPIAMSGYRVPRYEELVEHCRGIVDQVAASANVPVFSLTGILIKMI